MPDDDVNEVDLEQQPVGPGGEAGGGEWPDPDAPPTGPAPGESPRTDAPADPVGGDGTDTQAEAQQDGSTGGDRGEARLGEGPSGFKDALEADPVRGGSASTPHDDIPQDRAASPDPSAGGP